MTTNQFQMQPKGNIFKMSSNLFMMKSVDREGGDFELDCMWAELGTINSTTILNLLYTGSLFLATAGAGVFASSNNGASWVHLANPDSTRWLYSMAVSSGGTVVVASGYNNFYRSSGGLSSWSLVGNYSGWSNSATCAVCTDAGVFVFGLKSGEGFFISTDDGFTWKKKSPIGTNVTALIALSGGVVLAAVDGNIFRSTDNGSSWVQVYSAGYIIYGFATDNALEVMAGGGDNARIYRSRDAGVTWEYVRDLTATGSTTYVTSLLHVGDRTYIAGTNITNQVLLLQVKNSGDTVSVMPSTTEYVRKIAKSGDVILLASGSDIHVCESGG